MRREHFDAILVNSSGMAQFVEPYSDVPRIMQFVDLDSLKWQQYAENSSIPRSWIFRREFHCLLEYERNLARTFTHSLVCTPRELKDLERLVPGAAASCVSNGVDLEVFRPQSLEKIPGEMVFTGVMDYYPNIEGIVWFCRDVLPLIRRELPGVTLTICGSRPDARVKALARIPGVTVTGRVPDVRPYLRGRASRWCRCGSPGESRTSCSKRWRWACLRSRVRQWQKESRRLPDATCLWPMIRRTSPARPCVCSAMTSCDGARERPPEPAWKPITAGNTSSSGSTGFWKQ